MCYSGSTHMCVECRFATVDAPGKTCQACNAAIANSIPRAPRDGTRLLLNNIANADRIGREHVRAFGTQPAAEDVIDPRSAPLAILGQGDFEHYVTE